jgi:hypothetical protein
VPSPRRLLHDHIVPHLQISDEVIGDELRHQVIAVAEPAAAVPLEGHGNGQSKFIGIGWGQFARIIARISQQRDARSVGTRPARDAESPATDRTCPSTPAGHMPSINLPRCSFSYVIREQSWIDLIVQVLKGSHTSASVRQDVDEPYLHAGVRSPAFLCRRRLARTGRSMTRHFGAHHTHQGSAAGLISPL